MTCVLLWPGVALLSSECVVQTLAGCSQRWCRCLRRCPACAAGPSPAAPAGPAALRLRAPQHPAPRRLGALLALSWQEGWWRRSCSRATRTGRLQMRARQQRLPSALAGKPMTLLSQTRLFGREKVHPLEEDAPSITSLSGKALGGWLLQHRHIDDNQWCADGWHVISNGTVLTVGS